MFKLFFRAFLLLASVVLILVAIGYVLPRDYRIESSIFMQASPDEVFELVNSLPNWQHWSSFSESRIEGLIIEYGEIRAGEGAAQTWSDARGQGKLWITGSQSPSLIEYSLDFGDFPTMLSKIELTGEAGGTRVSWTSNGRLPSGAFYGYTAVLFPSQMAYQYDQDLLRLKELAEQP